MKLGTSQQAVLLHLKAKGPQTIAEVGASLYDHTSSCADSRSTDKHRRDWARRVLKSLAELGVARKLNGETGSKATYEAVRVDESLGIPQHQVQAIEAEVKMLLHASRDGMRTRGDNTQSTRFNCNDGFYGEAFGIMRGLALLGHGNLGRAVNTPENKANLKWWFDQLERQVLQEENYPGAGGDDSGRCDFCLERWGKDAAGRRRS